MSAQLPTEPGRYLDAFGNTWRLWNDGLFRMLGNTDADPERYGPWQKLIVAEEPERPTSMKRFHGLIPGMLPLFHTYCSEHPAFGTCADEEQAHRDIADHLSAEHAAVKQEGAGVPDEHSYPGTPATPDVKGEPSVALRSTIAASVDESAKQSTEGYADSDPDGQVVDDESERCTQGDAEGYPGADSDGGLPLLSHDTTLPRGQEGATDG